MTGAISIPKHRRQLGSSENVVFHELHETARTKDRTNKVSKTKEKINRGLDFHEDTLV